MPTPTTRPATAGPAATSPRATGRTQPGWLLPLGTVLGVLVVLEAISRLELLPSRYFPPVSAMLAELAGELGTGAFWVATGQTLQGWGAGLGLALVTAVPLGLVLGSVPLAYQALRPIVEFLRPVPSVALVPLSVLALGTNIESKIFLAFFASFWQLLIPAVYGVRDVDPVLLDTGRSYRLGRLGLLTSITLPAAVPYLVTGIRIASATALILSVTTELIIGVPGLGGSINLARSAGQPDLMYALIIATGLLGWALNSAFTALERRVLHWHPSQQEVAA